MPTIDLAPVVAGCVQCQRECGLCDYHANESVEAVAEADAASLEDRLFAAIAERDLYARALAYIVRRGYFGAEYVARQALAGKEPE